MHPVPGCMCTLCAEKIAAKKSVFERLLQRAYGNGLYVFIYYRLFRSLKRCKNRVHGKAA